jgi:hypothetical protein
VPRWFESRKTRRGNRRVSGDVFRPPDSSIWLQVVVAKRVAESVVAEAASFGN